MTTAEEIIGRLDRQLAKKGESVTVKRPFGSAFDSFATIGARIRITGYTGSEVQGAVQVTDSRFVMSPTSFNGNPTWQASAGGMKYPQIGDTILTQGVLRRIEQCERVVVGDAVVRIEGRIRGG